MLAAWLAAALLAPALAGVTYERTPHEDEAGPLDPAPITAVEREAREWRLKAERRGVLAALDAAVRWRADAVDTCMRAAGAPAASAVVDVALTSAGVPTVKAKKGADATLAGCVAASLGDQLPVPLYSAVEVSYTARFDPASASASVSGPASASGAAPAFSPAPAATPAPASTPAPAATPAPASTPAPAGTDMAFAPLVDAERGFGPVPWGGPSADHEGLYATSSRDGSTFYTRQADTSARWLGARTSRVTYGFGADGLYVVTIGVVGTTTAWQLREALTARYGAPKWDTRFGCYYWRGATLLLQLRPEPNSEVATITWLDIPRGRASGLADRLPGDRDDPTSSDSKRRMPKIFRDDGSSGEGSATAGPGSEASPASTSSPTPAPEGAPAPKASPGP
ncbi:MAG: hypothetical protein Q8P41_13590 [Pseudomonadota bacterium]|nr:hypothetical protein [Pseudomonadota bacterium]